MQAKIRWPKIGLFLLTLTLISVMPLTAEALEVKFCSPSCAADTTPTIRVSGPPSTVGGVTTARVTIASFTFKNRFTISGTVTSQQSGTLQKITFNPTAITANAGSGCNATNPCRLEIIATSHYNDFPLNKPTAGYPAGVFLAGFFTGTEPAHATPPNANGDTVSLTGEASGLKTCVGGSCPTTIVDSDALNKAVINATPGTSGDTAVSLPWSCTGNTACKFTATAALKSFNTQGQETVQQKCEGAATSCRTRLRTRVNVAIKTANNRVNLPAGSVTVDSEAAAAQGTTAAEILIAETLPPFENLNVEHLLVLRNNFALDARFTLDAGTGIAPDKEEVYLRIGSFGMSIPPGKFKRFLQGKLFTFVGKVEKLDVIATFARGSNPLKWTFAIGVHGGNLAELLPQPPAQVSVDLAVGSDTGSDLATASIFH